MHWITGRDGKDVSQVPPRQLIGPAALIDDWSRVSNGSGVEGDPTTASAEKGRRYAEEEATHLIHFCRQFKALPVAPRRNYTARGGDPNPYASDE